MTFRLHMHTSEICSLQSFGASHEVESTNKYKLGLILPRKWMVHGTAGVNESFNVRVEINKRPDLPPLWPKEHQGNLEWELTVTASISNSHKRVQYTDGTRPVLTELSAPSLKYFVMQYRMTPHTENGTKLVKTEAKLKGWLWHFTILTFNIFSPFILQVWTRKMTQWKSTWSN